MSTTPHNFNLSPHLTSPHPTHSFLYSLKTVDHPKRSLKVFCLNSKFNFFFLPIYHKIGWCQQVGYYFKVDEIYNRSIMIYLVCHVIFFFLYTLWSVDHNLLTVDHNLPCSQYSAKIVSFFLTIWSMHGRSYFTLPTKGWYFPPKVETYSRCCPSICTIAPGFYIFDQKFSLTRFFPKKCVNFSLPRQNKHDKIRSIISYKRQLIDIQKVRRLCYKAPKKTPHAPCRGPSER